MDSDDHLADSIGNSLSFYVTSADSDTRQQYVDALLQVLDKPIDEIRKEITRIASTLLLVAEDTEVPVRLSLIVRIPEILMRCRDISLTEFNFYLNDRLVEIVLNALHDEALEVSSKAYVTIMTLLQKRLLGKTTIVEKLCPAIVELSRMNVLHPTHQADYETNSIELMKLMAPIIGAEPTRQHLVSRFLEMCAYDMHFVRKNCAEYFPVFCQVLGTADTERLLLPVFLRLCDDPVWSVRKTAAGALLKVALMCTLDSRRERLAPAVYRLLNDPSRWVGIIAFECLGQFISLFAQPCITGLAYSDLGELSIMNAANPDFKDQCNHNLIANYAHYERIFEQSLTAPAEDDRPAPADEESASPSVPVHMLHRTANNNNCYLKCSAPAGPTDDDATMPGSPTAATNPLSQFLAPQQYDDVCISTIEKIGRRLESYYDNAADVRSAQQAAAVAAASLGATAANASSDSLGNDADDDDDDDEASSSSSSDSSGGGLLDSSIIDGSLDDDDDEEVHDSTANDSVEDDADDDDTDEEVVEDHTADEQPTLLAENNNAVQTVSVGGDSTGASARHSNANINNNDDEQRTAVDDDDANTANRLREAEAICSAVVDDLARSASEKAAPQQQPRNGKRNKSQSKAARKRNQNHNNNNHQQTNKNSSGSIPAPVVESTSNNNNSSSSEDESTPVAANPVRKTPAPLLRKNTPADLPAIIKQAIDTKPSAAGAGSKLAARRDKSALPALKTTAPELPPPETPAIESAPLDPIEFPQLMAAMRRTTRSPAAQNERARTHALVAQAKALGIFPADGANADNKDDADALDMLQYLGRNAQRAKQSADGALEDDPDDIEPEFASVNYWHLSAKLPDALYSELDAAAEEQRAAYAESGKKRAADDGDEDVDDDDDGWSSSVKPLSKHVWRGDDDDDDEDEENEDDDDDSSPILSQIFQSVTIGNIYSESTGSASASASPHAEAPSAQLPPPPPPLSYASVVSAANQNYSNAGSSAMRGLGGAGNAGAGATSADNAPIDSGWCDQLAALQTGSPTAAGGGGMQPSDPSNAPFEQPVVPAYLVRYYVAMVSFNDVLMNTYCAYNFPAVVLTLGRQHWHLAHQLLRLLCDNIQWKIRKTVAVFIYQIALIIGRELSGRDLVPIYLGFFKDLDVVKIEALRNLTNFLRVVDVRYHHQIVFRLGSCLNNYANNYANWRFREELAQQVLNVIEVYGTVYNADGLTFLVGIAINLLSDAVCSVRDIAQNAIVATIRICSPCDTDDLFGLLTEEFAGSGSWRKRQIYISICQKLITEKALQPEQFEERLLEALLPLANDSVPNIRLNLARLIAHSMLEHEYFSKRPVHQRLVAIVEQLRTDADRDVRFMAKARRADGVDDDTDEDEDDEEEDVVDEEDANGRDGKPAADDVSSTADNSADGEVFVDDATTSSISSQAGEFAVAIEAAAEEIDRTAVAALDAAEMAEDATDDYLW